MRRASLLYDVMLGLVAFGAFTKSAPTPVHIIAICLTVLGGASMILAASGHPKDEAGEYYAIKRINRPQKERKT